MLVGLRSLPRNVLVNQPGHDQQHHEYEQRPDEGRPFPDHQPRAYPGAQELPRAHYDSLEEMHLPCQQKKEKSHNIAGEIHYLGIRRGSHHGKPHQQHEGHGPEGAGSGAEKPVIETDGQPENQIKGSGGKTGMNILGPQPGREQRVEGNYRQKPGNQMTQQSRIEQLNRQDSQACAHGCPDDAGATIGQANCSGTDKVQHGAARPEGGLQLVGSQGGLGWHADPEQHRNGDQPASSCNGVYQAGQKGDQEKKGKKYRRRQSDRLAPGETFFQQSGKGSESVAEDKIDNGNEKENFRGKGHGAVVDLRSHVGQFGNPDNEGQRGILDQGNELVDKGGDHVAQPLGQDDVEHGLGMGQAGGDGRLHLPLGNSFDTGANNLRHIGRGKKGKAENDGPGFRKTLPENRGEQEIHPENYHQQRHAPYGVNEKHARQADPSAPGNAEQTEQQTAEKGEDARDNGQIDGQADSAQRAFGIAPDHEIGEVVGDYLKVGKKTHAHAALWRLSTRRLYWSTRKVMMMERAR